MANNQSKIRRFKTIPWKTINRDVIKGPVQSTVVDDNSTSPSVTQVNQSQELPLAPTPEIASKHGRLNRIIRGTLAKSKNILLGRSNHNIARSSMRARVSVQIESSDIASVQEVKSRFFGSLVFYTKLLLIAAGPTKGIKSNWNRSRGMSVQHYSCSPFSLGVAC